MFPLTPESQSSDDFDAAISSLCSEGSQCSVIVVSGATASRSPDQLNDSAITVDSNAFVNSDNTILQNIENLLLNFHSQMDIQSR